MRWPRRAPREVYRVFDEQDFLVSEPLDGPGGTEEPAARSFVQPSPGLGRFTEISLVPARLSPRTLVPALVLLAVIAAGAIALDAVSTLMRGRHRGVPRSRPASSRTASDHRASRPPSSHPDASRARSARRHRTASRRLQTNRVRDLPRRAKFLQPGTRGPLRGLRPESGQAEFGFEAPVER